MVSANCRNCKRYAHGAATNIGVSNDVENSGLRVQPLGFNSNGFGLGVYGFGLDV